MRTANLANEAVRQAEVGHVWEEQITNGAGSLELAEFTTFRVRAAAAVTVTIDGVLAMTMASGEIAVFNCGSGDPNDSKQTVTVAVTGTAFVQVARSVPRPLN